jgi:hypothetical protein
MSISIGQKVKHVDGAVAGSAAPNPGNTGITVAANRPHTGTVQALNLGRQYIVNGKTVVVDLCDVSWDNTPITNSQPQSALIGA